MLRLVSGLPVRYVGVVFLSRQLIPRYVHANARWGTPVFALTTSLDAKRAEQPSLARKT